MSLSSGITGQLESQPPWFIPPCDAHHCYFVYTCEKVRGVGGTVWAPRVVFLEKSQRQPCWEGRRGEEGGLAREPSQYFMGKTNNSWAWSAVGTPKKKNADRSHRLSGGKINKPLMSKGTWAMRKGGAPRTVSARDRLNSKGHHHRSHTCDSMSCPTPCQYFQVLFNHVNPTHFIDRKIDIQSW